MAMSSGLISGLFTVVLLLAFIGIVIWAWSVRRREQFEAAARQPLEEDEQQRP
jgi:cytochrome c oxidase cbb3-type subunit 4